jgi:glycosyltransferase involved in cell wall biosynthesis
MSAFGTKCSIVLNGHKERNLIVTAIKSVELGISKINNPSKCTFDLIIVLDSADDQTLKLTQDAIPNLNLQASLIFSNYSDLGEARNHGVKHSNSDWITFLDGDDLVGPNWLNAISENVDLINPLTVYHPAYLIYFGNSNRIHHQYSLNEVSNFDLIKLATVTNPWGSPLLAHKSLLLDNPYKRSDKLKHLGYEDWTFNRSTLEKGMKHHCFNDTYYLIRDRSESLSKIKTSNYYFPI